MKVSEENLQDLGQSHQAVSPVGEGLVVYHPQIGGAGCP